MLSRLKIIVVKNNTYVITHDGTNISENYYLITRNTVENVPL